MSYLREMAEQGYDPSSIGPFHRTMIPYVLALAGVKRDELVADVGAAQGHCIISAAQAGYSNLAVVDVEAQNFELFSTSYQIRCYLRDVEGDPLPFADNEVGAIVCFHLIEHLGKPDNFVREAFRSLKPNGVLALVTPDWRKQYKTFWRDPTHVHPYDKESISRLLRIQRFKEVRTHSWGSAYGLGRLEAYRWAPRLGMIGRDMLALAFKR